MKFAILASTVIAWELELPDLEEGFDYLIESVDDTLAEIEIDADDFMNDASELFDEQGQMTVDYINEATGAKKCTAVDVTPDFVLDDYLGTWYELYRSDDLPTWWYTGECTTAHYSLKSEDMVQVDNTCQDFKPDGTFEDRDEKTPGEATYQDVNNKNAHLKVRFSVFQPWGSYNILATDYETYSVVYECDNFLFDT